VLDAREELDTLDELAACPLIARNLAPYTPFFLGAGSLLTLGTPLAVFQARLQELLLPNDPQLLAFGAPLPVRPPSVALS
jgi:hypothetical protein